MSNFAVNPLMQEAVDEGVVASDGKDKKGKSAADEDKYNYS